MRRAINKHSIGVDEMTLVS